MDNGIVQYSLKSDPIWWLRCRLTGTLKPLVKYLMLQCKFLRWAAYLLIRGKWGYAATSSPRAFPLKNGWGRPTHFLRENPCGRGWMCRWLGSHFHDWVNYDGLAFSIELLVMGSHFQIFWGKTVLHLRLANVPECLYRRWKVKCFSFNLKKWVNS